MCTHQKTLWTASQDSALTASAVNLGESHHCPWLCLEQHKIWLHVKIIVNAGWVRFMPGGAQWRSGGQNSINEAIIQIKNFKKMDRERWSCW